MPSGVVRTSRMGFVSDSRHEAERAQVDRAGPALFHTVFLFAQKLRGFDYAVIEVNLRQVGCYQRALGFQVIGGWRHNTRVNAPAVLMDVSFADIAAKIERHAGKRKGGAVARNLYEHGFSKAEAEGILGRVRKLDAV